MESVNRVPTYSSSVSVTCIMTPYIYGILEKSGRQEKIKVLKSHWTYVLSLIHEQDLFARCAETTAHAVYVVSTDAQNYMEDLYVRQCNLSKLMLLQYCRLWQQDLYGTEVCHLPPVVHSTIV